MAAPTPIKIASTHLNALRRADSMKGREVYS